MSGNGMPCPGMPGQRGLRGRAGFSLVEAVVAVVVLGVGILGVSSAGTSVVRQLGTARGDMQLWASMQTVGDSLLQLGFGGVTGGSRSLGTYDLDWTIDKSIPFIERVTLRGWSTGRFMVGDTLVIYLGDPNAP